MREIKFRVWDKEYERMVVPYWFEVSHFSDKNRVNKSEWVYYEDWRDVEDGRSRACELMQFIGVKDENDVDVFDGDIVSVMGRKRRGRYLTKIIHHGCGFRLEENDTYLNDGIILPRMLRVVGNIYENPELLTSPLSENINS